MPRTPPIPQRIRSRRRDRGLRAFELAGKAGISPSYVSLIEKGAKVPDEDVAARLAQVLEDDEELYRAWAREARHGPTDPRTVGRLRLMASDPALRRRVARGDDLDDLSDLEEGVPPAAAALVAEFDGVFLASREASREESAVPEPGAVEYPELLEVPILFEGADPGEDSPHPSSVQDRLQLDQKLFASGAERNLFAYVISRESGEHVRGLASPGDFVVFRRRARRISPQRIHAVRVKGRVVLSRVLFKGSALLLLPPEQEGDFDVLEVGDEAGARRAIAGYSVLLIRR